MRAVWHVGLGHPGVEGLFTASHQGKSSGYIVNRLLLNFQAQKSANQTRTWAPIHRHGGKGVSAILVVY